ncbi:hypothetical protein [Pseudorhodoferax sp.]|uniref:hypothetical protein n=1 Tax=Pseudorhodoferax sp. TaxID=1993553 RepID=UPI0039E2B781
MPSDDDFSPTRLMTSAELGKARRLLNKLDRHRERVQRDDALPSSERKGYEFYRDARKAIDREFDALASTVLARELGLERYMVIHTIRSGGHEKLMQLLSMGFQDDRWSRLSRWMWSLHGRRLRKDGTIGDKPDWTCIGTGLISRRQLDGGWTHLCWRPAKDC